jgi:AcrR family transcriptional regulator
MTRHPKHDDPQAAILAAARALILEKGPEQLSLREVARRSTYSPAALYEYFDGKDALITAVADESLAQLTAALRRVATDLPTAQRLVALGLAYVRFAHDHPYHFRLIFQQLPARRQSLAEPVSATSPYRLVLEAVAHGVAQGEVVTFPSYGVEEIAYSLWVLAHGIAMLRQTHLLAAEPEAATVDRRVFEVFVQGLTRP